MKNESKKQKFLIIFGILAIIICLGIIIKSNLDSRKSFIIIDTETWAYTDKEWYNLNNTSNVFDNYDFNVYADNKYQGKYEMKYFNDIWYFFDEENDSHKFNGDIFAYAGSEKVDLIDISKEELNENDLSTINNALKEKNTSISSLEELTIKEKIEYDFNKDGQLETIYNINNISNDYSNEQVFTCVIYQDKIMIYDDDIKENEDDLYSYNLKYLINFENKNNLILSAGKNLDISSTKYLMYTFSKNKFEKIKESSDQYININANNKDNFNLDLIIIILTIAIIAIIVFTFIKRRKESNNKI
ncbi:MAG: hypothetical protein ACI4OT_03250 [Bacilli bacterium]